MNFIKCDHCGSEFTVTEYKNYFVTKTKTHTVHVLVKPRDMVVERTYDLCNSCYTELLKWLNDSDEDNEGEWK